MVQLSLRGLLKFLRPRSKAARPVTSRRDTRLGIESLEERRTPAFILPGPTLLIFAPTNLTVLAVGNNLLQVTDNGVTDPRTFNSSNVLIVGTDHNEATTVDLNGFTLSGTLSIVGGSQRDVINVQSSAPGGQISGKVFIDPGLGNDLVNLNGNAEVIGTSNIPVPAIGLTFGDAVTVVDPGGNDAVFVGSTQQVTQFKNDLNIIGENLVFLSPVENDLYGGNINISMGSHGGPLSVFEGGSSNVATVAGSVNIISGSGVNSNTVDLGGITIGKDLNVVLGNTQPVFGSGTGNFVGVTDASNAITTVNGNATLTLGNGANLADLGGGNFKNNLAVNFGTGNDTLTLETFNGQQTKIGANLLVTGGNGNITVGGGGNNTAAITGSATFNLGGGNNSVSFDSGSSVGGTISYTNTGSGNNHLTLSSNQNYNVSVHFGAGDDTFTLNSGNLAGFVDGGGHVAGNVFQNFSGGTVTATIVNFQIFQP